MKKRKSHKQVMEYLEKSLSKKFHDVHVEAIQTLTDNEIYVSMCASISVDQSEDEALEQASTYISNTLQGMNLNLESLEEGPINSWNMDDATKHVYISYFLIYEEQ